MHHDGIVKLLYGKYFFVMKCKPPHSLIYRSTILYAILNMTLPVFFVPGLDVGGTTVAVVPMIKKQSNQLSYIKYTLI